MLKQALAHALDGLGIALFFAVMIAWFGVVP